MKTLMLVVIVGAIGLGACTLLDDDPPKTTCTIDSECFQAQGERCNLAKHLCEQRSDAGVDAP